SSLTNFPIELTSVLADSWKLGGSEKNPESELIKKIEDLGGTLSISSQNKKTVLSLSFLSKDEEKILEYLAELIQTPAFPETIIDKSKKKVMEGILRRNERTESLGFRKAREIVYEGFRRGIVPQLETTKIITRDMILEFYKEILASPKAVVVSGKYSREVLLKRLKEILKLESEKLKYPKEEIPFHTLREKFYKKSLSQIFIQKPVNQSMILYFGIIPQHNHPDFYAIQLLNYIIGGGGFNSYLMQQIRQEKGLAYSAASYPIFEAKHGTIYFYTLTKNETLKEADELIQKILSLETFQNIKEKELEDAKNSIINQFVFLFTNKHSVLSAQLGFDEDEMPENYLEIYRDKMKEVTLSDILRVGKEYLAKEKLKRLYISSKENLEKVFPNQKYYDPEDLLLE
ncbi:MAG: insulinase family protein, partial [Leptospiraceae bacterium]|nr:insulinase family protein [Leptospiraceae bacterium]